MAKTQLKLNISRTVATVLLLFAMLLPLIPVKVGAAASGSCGDHLSWTYNAGTLTITGSGDMQNYYDGFFAPWHEFREDIIKVNLPEGLTSIGSFAFIGCKNIKSISIPDSVTSISHYAFASCEKLASVKLSNQLKIIGDSAFYNCIALNALTLPYDLREIGSKAFYRCESLSAVKIHRNLTTLGTSAFAYCTSLVRAEIDAPLAALPSWTFFGCHMLTDLSIAEAVEEIEDKAFESCDNLTNVYCPVEKEQSDSLKEQISADVSSFDRIGVISSASIPNVSTGGSYTENEDHIATRTNITVWRDSYVWLEYSIQNVLTDGKLTGSSVVLQLTLEQQSAWNTAIEQLSATLTKLKDDIADNTYTLKVYLKNDATLAKSLTDLMTGRNVKMEIMSASGSVWRVNGADLVVKEDIIEAAPPVHDFSHTVVESDQDTKDKLGTDDCFDLNFSESMENKAEILVQLPPTAAGQGSNAFLYQVEENGEHTRLQGVTVDNDAVAHFYLASTDKDTQYVIGVNVPGEDTKDVIIPDELLTEYNNALARLEEIEYVATGKREVAGLGLSQIMVITFIILGVCIIVIGVVMFFWNKKRLARMYATAQAS